MRYTYDRLLEIFRQLHNQPRDLQAKVLAEFELKLEGGVILEMGTGEGKSTLGVTALLAAQDAGLTSLFYITTNIAQAMQLAREFPDRFVLALGRDHHQCNYYAPKKITAAQAPCQTLRRCPHRVFMKETEIVDEQGESQTRWPGQTFQPGADKCNYFNEKLHSLLVALGAPAAGSAKIVLTTTAYFVMNRLLLKEWRELHPAMIVLDEAHNLARIVRRLFELRITDVHLFRMADKLKPFEPTQAALIHLFAKKMFAIARKRSPRIEDLLEEDEVNELLDIAEELNRDHIQKAVERAVDSGALSLEKDLKKIKALESLAFGLDRLLRSLRYATTGYHTEGFTIAEEKKRALNYVVASYLIEEEDEEDDGPTHKKTILRVRSYFVAGIIKKTFGHKLTDEQKAAGKHRTSVLAYSATIGDHKIFYYETGLNLHFVQSGSSFDPGKARIYRCSDMPNLAARVSHWGHKVYAFKQIIESAKVFIENGHRCLVLLVSDNERLGNKKNRKQKGFLHFAREAGIDVMTYDRSGSRRGNEGMNSRQALEAFRNEGRGDLLLGTVAQYGEGIDLPAFKNDDSQVHPCPVIFLLRPSFPSPRAPESRFEHKRMGKSGYFKLMYHRAALIAVQARGRNIRSHSDMGVTFYVSQQFEDFLYNALPDELHEPPTYQVCTMGEGVQDALTLLGCHRSAAK